MKLYLAGPLFTSGERQFNRAIAQELDNLGYSCWLPQANEPRNLTAKSIFDIDIEGIDWADVVVACMDGSDPDSGTCFECGYAYANSKPIICYRTDFRGAGDIEGSKYNLMMWASSAANVQTPMDAYIVDIASSIHSELIKL
jgi:nucleoside 2-deoxyribosyltransferase